MNIKNFVLSYYKNSANDFHIQKTEKTYEAQKPHTHEYFQIYYIVRGSLVHFVEKNSSQLTHGDMFIIPPQRTHYIEPTEDTVFYSFSFMPDFLGDNSTSNRLASSFLRSLQSKETYSVRPKISIKPEEIFYVESMMEHILKEFHERPLGYDETVRAYALLLVTMLARNYFEMNVHALPDHFETNKQFVMHCVEYIESNFTDGISLGEIVKRSTMSKSSFCKMFQDLTGHTFNRYLNICRIKKAAEYIRQGYKITAVYGICGYNDFSTFYRNFKNIMGVSPREYKN